MPGAPPTTSTEPARVLVVLGRLRGTSERIVGRHQPMLRLDRLEPDVGDDERRRRGRRPGATASPTLRPWKVTVSVGADGLARDLAGRRVDARGNVDGDDRRRGGVDPLDRRRRLGARLAVEARAEERVDDHVGLLDGGRLDRVAALLAQDPRGDPPVAAVRAAAADDGDPARVGEALQHLARDRRAGPLHQLRRALRVAGIALLGRAHLGRACRAAQASATTHTAEASSRECVIERSIAPAPTRSAQAATRPESRTDGFGRPAISMSFQANARATPKPSAFPTASLPAKRPGVALGRVLARVAVRLLGRREAAVLEALRSASSERRTRSISIRSTPTRVTARGRSSRARCAIELSTASGIVLERSSVSGRNLPVRSEQRLHAEELRAADVLVEVVGDHPGQLRLGVERGERGGEAGGARLADHRRLDAGRVLERGDEGAAVEHRAARGLPPRVLVQAEEVGAGLDLGERAREVHVAEDLVRLGRLVAAADEHRVGALADELDPGEIGHDRGHHERVDAPPAELAAPRRSASSAARRPRARSPSRAAPRRASPASASSCS